MRKFIMTTAVCFWAMSQMMAQNISGKIAETITIDKKPTAGSEEKPAAE